MARRRAARNKIVLTQRSVEPGSADASVFVDTVLAGCAILAWLRDTVINVDFAIVAAETRDTRAQVSVHGLDAVALVLAR